MTARSQITNCIAASLLVCVSSFISLGFSELFVRSVLDPVDYLAAYLVDDEILKHKVKPRSAGHDDWGYRNKSVPVSADIVAIGDSQTYGVSATAKNSWPAQLQQLTGRNVYNLSLGGFGAVQYYHLLKTHAFALRPSLIIVGFYFGNDLFEAYDMVYTVDYWQYLRRAEFVGHKIHNQESEKSFQSPPKFMGKLRDWFAHHSVLYRMITLSFGNMFRFVEMQLNHASTGGIVVLEDADLGIRTGFTPAARLTALDLGDRKIQEGLRLTLQLFQEMKVFCSENGIEFQIVLIPTKESVFAAYINNNDQIRYSDVIDRLIINEREVNRLMNRYFQQHEIPYIDVLEPLREAVKERRIYPANQDGHPNRAGYEVIARAVADSLGKGSRISSLVH